jgi:hypothetical protein
MARGRRKKKPSTLAQRRAARKRYQKVAKTSKPGSGKRFAALKRVAELSGTRDPGAVAAKIGRKKYGKKKFQAMAIAGRKRKKRKS